MHQLTADQLTLAEGIIDVTDENTSNKMISVYVKEIALVKVEQYNAFLLEAISQFKKWNYNKHSMNGIKVSTERTEMHSKQISFKSLIVETKR